MGLSLNSLDWLFGMVQLHPTTTCLDMEGFVVLVIVATSMVSWRGILLGWDNNLVRIPPRACLVLKAPTQCELNFAFFF